MLFRSQDEKTTLYHGDCLQILPELKNIDLIFTSPPYNLQGTLGTEWGRLKTGYNTHNDKMAEEDYVKWQKDTLLACWETLSETGAIFYNHKPRSIKNNTLLPTRLNPGLPLRQIIIWDRGSGFQRDGAHFVPSHEWILILAREKFRLTTRTVNDVWKASPCADKDHPASFPLALPMTAISSTEAKVILDPFAGSGTTLRAAKDLGRHSVGIEIDEKYCEIAALKLSQDLLF